MWVTRVIYHLVWTFLKPHRPHRPGEREVLWAPYGKLRMEMQAPSVPQTLSRFPQVPCLNLPAPASAARGGWCGEGDAELILRRDLGPLACSMGAPDSVFLRAEGGESMGLEGAGACVAGGHPGGECGRLRAGGAEPSAQGSEAPACRFRALLGRGPCRRQGL